MNKGDEWEDSICTDVWLHRYNPVLTTDYGVCDVCELCGDEQYYRILGDGSSDNQEFLSHNLRLALTSAHPQSKHEYAELFIQNYE